MYHSDRNRPTTRNLQAIENLMDRRLRPRKRDRVLFALKRGQIADEIKTLTAKLEDSFRVFMVQTEWLAPRSKAC